MKKNLFTIATTIALLFSSQISFASAPSLGTAADFVVFTTDGALLNTGITHLTGNVGTNNGSIAGFGNVNGGMHNSDGVSATCAEDLLAAYDLLDAAIPTFFPAALMGNGQILNAGIYSIGANASLNNVLTLDGQGNANAEFIIQIQGTLSAASLSQVVLINNAKACNVFWKVEGMISLAAGSSMKGNLIANNAEIVINTGAELEGRALTTAGAITLDGVLAYTPVGCGSPYLTGPTAPSLASTSCYAVFSSNGAVTNSGVSLITGDVGTNVELTSGFSALDVTGAIHPIPDGSTAAAAADLILVNTYLTNLTEDIELLYPAQFGNNLVLTPHTYLMNAAAIFTDSLYLNAMGNTDAVFVIKINGAHTTSTYAKVLLINGTQAKNIYWNVTGAVEINDYSEFKGTIVNNEALNIKTGTTLLGRALTTNGAVGTAAFSAAIPSPCITTAISETKIAESAILYPNPMTKSFTLYLDDASDDNVSQLTIYNSDGRMMLNKKITDTNTFIQTNYPTGIYLYKIINENNTVQSGTLISK
jgi:hypothetical protein